MESHCQAMSSKVIGEFRYDLYEDFDIPYYEEDHCIYKALMAGQLYPYGICKMMQCLFNIELRKNKDYNALQQVASDISGYGKLGESGDKYDDYYDKKDMESKIDQVMHYSSFYNEWNLTREEAKRVVKWLDTDFDSQDEMYWAFKDLK